MPYPTELQEAAAREIAAVDWQAVKPRGIYPRLHAVAATAATATGQPYARGVGAVFSQVAAAFNMESNSEYLGNVLRAAQKGGTLAATLGHKPTP